MALKRVDDSGKVKVNDIVMRKELKKLWILLSPEDRLLNSIDILTQLFIQDLIQN